MWNLVSAEKSLLIELSSVTKYECIVGLTAELAKIAFLNIIHSLWSSKVLVLLGIHVQTFVYARHMYKERGRHLALGWILT